MTKIQKIVGIPLIAFCIFFFVYLFTSSGQTPYDYFTRLSDAFLAGKYYLTENPSWLSELIPAGDGKYFVVYPPMPAILLMPFRALFGEIFQQQYLAHILGAGIVALTILISWSLKKDRKLAIWSGVLIGAGSIVWFLSSVGSSWYLGQVSAAFFISAAILESLNRKRSLLVGVFLGAAFLSRLQTILTLPLFLFVLYQRQWFKKYLLLGLGILPFIAFNFYYNFIRFGVIWDKAYLLIPGLLQEPWYQGGLFNLANIPNHLRVIFASFPIITKEFPYFKPPLGGLAIWITTPAFVYSLFAKIKERAIQVSWFVIILVSLVIFSHGTTGFTQFGYRFAVDFYPILTFLTIKGVIKTNLKWHHWLLLIIGVVVNIWGVLFINKLGLFSF